MADPTEMVFIKNPSLPTDRPGRVNRATFESHFQPQGFQIVDDAGNPVDEQPEQDLAQPGTEAPAVAPGPAVPGRRTAPTPPVRTDEGTPA